MKAKTQSTSKHRPYINPFGHDLLPHLDKPRLRRALGSATVAGGLMLNAASAKAQDPPATFLLRSVDSPREIELPWIERGYDPPVLLLDIDADGDLDMIQQSFYENAGTRYEPRFKQPRPLEDVGITELPFDITFADFDGDGDPDKALLGTGEYFENIGTSDMPEYVERAGAANPLAGIRFEAAAAADLNGDGFAELVDWELGVHANIPVGAGRGFADSASHPFTRLPGGFKLQSVAFGDLDGDGDYDALVFEKEGYGYWANNFYAKNIGNAQTPYFVDRGGHLPADFDSGIFGGIPGTDGAPVTFSDTDGDGDFDARVAGGGSQTYRNVGTARQPEFVPDDALDRSTFPSWSDRVEVDIDNDGDLDVFTGLSNGEIRFSPRHSNGEASPGTLSNPFAGFQFSRQPILTFVDIDADQDLDVFVGAGNQLYFFENVHPPPAVPDVDTDGLPDVWEQRYFGSHEAFDGRSDPDRDGITNAEELAARTDPAHADTDRDGFLDPTELAMEASPRIGSTDPPITTFSAVPDPYLTIRGVQPATVALEALLPDGLPVELKHSGDLDQWAVLSVGLVGQGRRQTIEVPRTQFETLGFYALTPIPPDPALPPPPPEPGPPEAFPWRLGPIDYDRATISGLVRPGLVPTLYYFEWRVQDRGVVEFTNRSAAFRLPAGGTTTPVQTQLEGLLSNQAYDYRLVASNEFEVVSSALDTFVTAKFGPRFLAGYDTLGTAHDLAVAGHLAYVAGGQTGLMILDVSDPAQPTLVGAYHAGETIVGVHVAGNRAYLAAGADGLLILDVSDPAHPTLIPRRNLNASADTNAFRILSAVGAASPTEVTIEFNLDMDLRFAADPFNYWFSGPDEQPAVWVNAVRTNANRRIYRLITSPLVPTTTYTLAAEAMIDGAGNFLPPVRIEFVPGNYAIQEVTEVHVEGNRAYVIGNGNSRGLQIVDVSDPAWPVRLSGLHAGGSRTGIFVTDGVAYVVGWPSGADRPLQMIDVNDASAPVWTSDWTSSGIAWDIQVQGQEAFLAVDDDNGTQVKVLDLTDPQNITETRNYYLPVEASGLHVAGDLVFVAAGPDGFRIYRFDPAP